MNFIIRHSANVKMCHKEGVEKLEVPGPPMDVCVRAAERFDVPRQLFVVAGPITGAAASSRPSSQAPDHGWQRTASGIFGGPGKPSHVRIRAHTGEQLIIRFTEPSGHFPAHVHLDQGELLEIQLVELVEVRRRNRVRSRVQRSTSMKWRPPPTLSCSRRAT